MSNSLPPWRSPLASAIHRNRAKPYSRYVQLATITPEGIPANRTVVFRGFLAEEQHSLQIITDARSSKIQDIKHQAVGEICWYFSQTREQFRFRGNLRLITPQETQENLQKARQLAWLNLSDSGRSQFAWPTPAQPVADKSAFDIDLDALDSNCPLDNFYLLLLTPNRVDHLQLKRQPQQRCLYFWEANDVWSTKLVNP